MKSKIQEYLIAFLIILGVSLLFFLTLRFRLGPMYEQVFIDPAGLLQQRPWMNFSARQLKAGYFPLWNPYIGFGQPHLANLQSAVFYPLNFIVYLGGIYLGYELWLWLRLTLGGFFLYLFLRRMGLKKISCYAGAFTWSLGGYGLWFMQLVDLNSQILLPVFLIFYSGLAEKPRVKYFFGAILTGALIIWGGHPEAIFNCFLIAGLYYLFLLWVYNLKGRIFFQRASLLVFSFSGAVILSFLVLLPFLNYLSRCWSLHYPGFGFFHLDIRTFPSFLISGWYPASRGAGRMMVELLGRGSWSVFQAGYLRTIVPGVLPGAGIVAFFLAGLGFARLKILPARFSFFAFLGIIFLGLTYGMAPFRWLAFVPPFDQFSNYKFYFSEINFCLAVLLGAGLNLIARKSRFWTGILFALLLLSLYLYTFQLSPYIDLKNSHLEEKTWIKQISEKYQKEGPFKISGIDEPYPLLPPNLASLFGLEDLRSSDALFPENYFFLLDRLNRLSQKERLNYFYPEYYLRPLNSALFNPEIDLYGIRYILVRDISHLRGAEKKYRISKIEDGWLLENPDYFPRIFFCKDKNLNYQDCLRGLEIRIEKYLPDSIRLKAELPFSGCLVVSNLYEPGWRVRVNGKEARIEESEGFWSLYLSAGTHQIIFKYQPRDFEIGLVVSLAGFIIFLGVILLRRRGV